MTFQQDAAAQFGSIQQASLRDRRTVSVLRACVSRNLWMLYKRSGLDHPCARETKCRLSYARYERPFAYATTASVPKRPTCNGSSGSLCFTENGTRRNWEKRKTLAARSNGAYPN